MGRSRKVIQNLKDYFSAFSKLGKAFFCPYPFQREPPGSPSEGGRKPKKIPVLLRQVFLLFNLNYKQINLYYLFFNLYSFNKTSQGYFYFQMVNRKSSLGIVMLTTAGSSSDSDCFRTSFLITGARKLGRTSS